MSNKMTMEDRLMMKVGALNEALGRTKETFKPRPDKSNPLLSNVGNFNITQPYKNHYSLVEIRNENGAERTLEHFSGLTKKELAISLDILLHGITMGKEFMLDKMIKERPI